MVKHGQNGFSHQRIQAGGAALHGADTLCISRLLIKLGQELVGGFHIASHRHGECQYRGGFFRMGKLLQTMAPGVQGPHQQGKILVVLSQLGQICGPVV